MTEPRIQTTVVDGLALAKSIRKELGVEIGQLVADGHRPPCLATVVVGDDPASLSYVKGKQRACARIQIETREHLLPAETPQDELLALVDALNADDGVDGILVQLPLPAPLDAIPVIERLDPAKDADGLHPSNAGRLLLGTAELVPCTPLGVMAVLDHYQVPLEGAHAVVIGRSNLVGKPVSLLLQQRHATVTMCHSRTRDLRGLCRSADVLVAATGRARMVKGDWIRPGAAVVDVGVSVIDGQLVGDVDLEAALGVAGLITPPRGGIGPMTITMLLRNTLRAYRLRKGV